MCIHPDTGIRRRSVRITDVDIVIGGGQGRLKSGAGRGIPCGSSVGLSYLMQKSTDSTALHARNYQRTPYVPKPSGPR